ncbi:MAG: LacI family DNA-binding transcriptional regulator [Pirellulales bacterium]|nr:LacI family DNA-binding transcriptional regulator [Pirellulales bacterium]
MSAAGSTIEIVSGNKVPLYRQVAKAIQTRIRTGMYVAEGRLPSMRALSDELGVTVSVVHRAMRELEREGIVTTEHGRGMAIVADKSCEQAAILFGFIHPYSTGKDFSRSVLGYVSQAFEGRANLAVTRTSKDDPVLEREIAEHLIANGVKGLLIWGVNDDSNGPYFTQLTKKVPVVLVDRLLRDADLPAVVLDYLATGREICNHLLETMGRKRLLVLMDNLHISAYGETISGVEQAAAEMGRSTDVTIVQYPVSDVIEPIHHRDFSRVDVYREHVERLLREGGYDAVFCISGVFLDRVLVETGLLDAFPGIQTATLCNQGIHTGSRRFCEISPLQWNSNQAEMIAIAADMLQEWVLSRRITRNIVRIPFRRLHGFNRSGM